MLANLLTVPGRRLVMVEPWITEGAHGAALRRQSERFGWDVGDAEWAERPYESVAERWERVFGERLAGLEAWGCKEVVPTLHAPTIAFLRPRRVIVLVRHLFDVTLSLLELDRQHGAAPGSGYDDKVSYLSDSAAEAVQMLDAADAEHVRVVRYEDLISSSAYRSKLQRWLTWGFGGELYTNMDLYDRGYEEARHGPAITAMDVSASDRRLESSAVELATHIARSNADYQDRFGYVETRVS